VSSQYKERKKQGQEPKQKDKNPPIAQFCLSALNLYVGQWDIAVVFDDARFGRK